MSKEWDKLWDEVGEPVKYSLLRRVKDVGDKQQKDLIFWQEACAEMQIYKNGLYDKLEEIRVWAKKHRFAFIKDVEQELFEVLGVE